MRCKDVEASLYEITKGPLPASLREHLSTCPHCRAAWEELGIFNTGFQLLAQDPVPEPMLGFTARVMRRLESTAEAGASADEFFERVGRRFVLASLLITLSLLLLFALPSSGPLRGMAADEPYLSQSEPNQSTEAIVLGEDYPDAHNALPANPTDGGTKKQK